MNWLYSGRKRGGWEWQRAGVADGGFFCLEPWLSVTLLLSLKLEFIFYKLEWNVFVFQVIISILLGGRLHLMKWAHQSVRRANEAVCAGCLAAWLAAWLAGSYLLLQSTCWSDRLATKGPSAQESCQCYRRQWAGQWSREVAWAISHVPTRVQNAQKPERAWAHNRGSVGRKTEKRKESGWHLHVLEFFYQW